MSPPIHLASLCTQSHSGYTISTQIRPSRGDGIALLYKNHMEVKKNEAQHLHTIEYAMWQVSLKNKTITILGIYHPPPKQYQTNTTFLDEITKLLTSTLPNMENAIILGDFNMHREDLTDNKSNLCRYDGGTRPTAACLSAHSQRETYWISYSLKSHQNYCKRTGDTKLHLLPPTYLSQHTY